MSKFKNRLYIEQNCFFVFDTWLRRSKSNSSVTEDSFDSVQFMLQIDGRATNFKFDEIDKTELFFLIFWKQYRRSRWC